MAEGWAYPLLIRADRHLAGSVLVSEWSALGLPLDHVVAEFFVLRKYWRTRVGTRAALLVFRRYPGQWEVPVAWYNAPAQAFWRGVTEEVAPGEVEEIAGDGKRWTRPVLRSPTKPSRVIGARPGFSGRSGSAVGPACFPRATPI